MPYQLTTSTKKAIALKKRIRAIAGGTSAGKTITILQCLIDIAQSWPDPDVISVVSESLPHLKRGAMRDFENIMKEHNYWSDASWNKTECVYTFSSGWKLEFFGADSPDKLRGPRRRVLYINEANNVPFHAFEQLEVRTKTVIYMDWNPTNEFWFYTDLLEQRSRDIDFITLTYLDNEALDRSIIESIESRRGNKSWWRVYGEGQLGDFEGKIYQGWEIVDSVPFEARLEGYGLDFGYTNDPTAVIGVYYYNGGYILDEVLYQKGVGNKQIADVFENIDSGLVVGDSAEPKSIDELKGYGLNILPATKGPGSVNTGIQKLQSMKVSMTKNSTNLIKEYRNYMWLTDRDGKILNIPMDAYNHGLDAVRYRMETIGNLATGLNLQVVGYTEGLGGVMIPEYDFN